MNKTVKAKKVREGDFLTGLDNGYVYVVTENDEYTTEILFHDAKGEENIMILQNNFRLDIRRD